MDASFVTLYDYFPEEHICIADIVPIVGQDGVGSHVWIVKPSMGNRPDTAIGIPLRCVVDFMTLFGHVAIALQEAEDATN